MARKTKEHDDCITNEMFAFREEVMRDGVKCKIKGLENGCKPPKFLMIHVLKNKQPMEQIGSVKDEGILKTVHAISGFTLSTEGQLPTPPHHKDTSDPLRMNVWPRKDDTPKVAFKDNAKLNVTSCLQDKRFFHIFRQDHKVLECSRSICGSAKAARLLTRKCKYVTSGIRALVEAMMKTIRDQVAGSDTTNVESSQQGRGHEEQRDPVIPKLMGKSKDLTASFESLLTRVEEGMGAVDAHMENLDQRVEGLETDIAKTHEEVREALTKLGESNRVDLQALRDKFMAEVARFANAYQRELNSLLIQLEEARGDLALCKKAVLAGPTTSTVESRRVDIPKPKSFANMHNAREVDNFLWGLEQYSDVVGIIDDRAMIKSVALYLTDTAMLRWCRRQEDVKRGMCSITTFYDFKGELKRKFYPENAEEEARGHLRRLKHLGSIRDYVKNFINLVLEILDMFNKDSLFFFMDSLQAWAKIELRHRGVQDLATAIAIAESLIDYSSKKESSKSKEKKDGPNNGGVEHWRGNRKEDN
ncbi:hypothetical protein M9H77_02436 [Catharanthus roseus]|uniref:Uncharacterized protein n=1 Tax=Catharanthus roseus TaxID=4058 RepID=A0ACC0C8U0_CATRO|nr:hypothetical protein M9H77_02436 [Catharanthus roseus]